jgi:hypothetical protein
MRSLSRVENENQASWGTSENRQAMTMGGATGSLNLLHMRKAGFSSGKGTGKSHLYSN